jgi:hypothetical protein
LVVGAPFFIAGGEAPELFQAVDEPFDFMALPIQGAIKGACSTLTAFTGNRDADPMAPQVLPDRPTAVGLIAHQAVRAALGPAAARSLDRPRLQQGHHQGCLMALTSRQQQCHRLSVALGAQMNLGAEAALTAA